MSEREQNIEGSINTIDRTLAFGRDRNGTDVVRGDVVLSVYNGSLSVGRADVKHIRDGANVELLETDDQFEAFVLGINFIEVASTQTDTLAFVTRQGENAEFNLADDDDGVHVIGRIHWKSGQSHDNVDFVVPFGATVEFPGTHGNYITHVVDTNELVVSMVDDELLDFESSGINQIERIQTPEDAVRQILEDFPWMREDLLYSQEGGVRTLNAYILDVVNDINNHGLALIDTRRAENLSRRSSRSGNVIGGPNEAERYYLACLDYVRLCQMALAMEVEYDDNFQDEVFSLLADMENAASDRVNLMNQFINQRYPQFADRERYYKTNRFFLPLEGRRDRAGYHLNDHIGVDISVTEMYETEEEAFNGLVMIDHHERNHLGVEDRRPLWGDETYEEVLSAEMLTILTDAIVEGPDGLEIDLSIVTSNEYNPAFASIYKDSVLAILNWVQRAVEEQEADYDTMIGSLIFTAKTGILYANRRLLTVLDDVSADNGFVISASRGWKHFPLYNLLSRYYDSMWLYDTLRNNMCDRVLYSRASSNSQSEDQRVNRDDQLLMAAVNNKLQAQYSPS